MIDADLTIHRLDTLLWLARLTQDGPLATCMVCRQESGSIWGYQQDGVKVGLHLQCVEASVARGKLAGMEPAPAVVVDDVAAWVWQRLAPWYDQ